jgi:hypothetical protein
MRTKLVIWGTNSKDERVLLALELLPEQNEVALYVFPETSATDEFVKHMMDDWRMDKPVSFPDAHETIRRPLTLADSLLPDEYKVERSDLVQRAQSEWAFVVLSHKLQATLASELDSFKERVHTMQEFSLPLWEELKGFWDKVQNQFRERNLFRDHVDALRKESDELFAHMKKLRQATEATARKRSAELASGFSEKLDDVFAKIEEGTQLINTFESLKGLQREYHDLDLTRDDRNKLWNRLDKAFKLIKEKRFGERPAGGGSANPASRTENRLKGLLDAIGKMSQSIQRDEKDLQYEQKRIATGSQLEVQLRQAKLQMIEDRLSSKKEKLEDMLRTKEDLERRIEEMKKKIAEEEEKKRIEEAKEQVKARIAKEIEETEKVLEEKADELTAAAQEIAETLKPAKPSTPATEGDPVAPKDTNVSETEAADVPSEPAFAETPSGDVPESEDGTVEASAPSTATPVTASATDSAPEGETSEEDTADALVDSSSAGDKNSDG